ncbi:MAG: TrbC/VirB2 family protein [Alphaproteobacteria bacterium]|nr:TrbC/VirB2 family protein [Alphaproteobacteria bacterium]
MLNKIAPQSASKQLIDSRDHMCRLSLSFFVFSLLLFVPDLAHAGAPAAGSDPLSTTICLVVGWFTNEIGAAIATLGIIVLGIGAMMGKVSWQMALIVAFGVSIMFSGARVVELLTSQDASFCTGNPGFSAGYIEDVLCEVAGWANTASGRALGTLAIVFLGITTMLGKISIGATVLLGMGIAMLFGADYLGQLMVESLGGTWMTCSPGFRIRVGTWVPV